MRVSTLFIFVFFIFFFFFFFVFWFFFFFFFFQAEDGIRDLTVTGVQTCALPILRLVGGGRRRRLRDPAHARRCAPRLFAVAGREHHALGPRHGGGEARQARAARSEERRVGKECRSRGSADR